MGARNFLEKVWAWKAESGGHHHRQLRRLGRTCDWSRGAHMDEGLCAGGAQVFVDLYKADLIYKDKRLVHWDPKLLTAISDLEVQLVETKGHSGTSKIRSRAAMSSSPWRPRGPRPCWATSLGRGASGEQRLRHLIGKTAILPLVAGAFQYRRRLADRKGDRAPSDHAGARLNDFRRRQAGTTCRL